MCVCNTNICILELFRILLEPDITVLEPIHIYI